MRPYNGHRHCGMCGKRLLDTQPNWCSQACEQEAFQLADSHPHACIPGIGELARPTKPAERACIWCGEPFDSNNAGNRVCGDCKAKGMPSTRRQGIRNCTWCGEAFANTVALNGCCPTCTKLGKPADRKRATRSGYRKEEVEPLWEDKQ